MLPNREHWWPVAIRAGRSALRCGAWISPSDEAPGPLLCVIPLQASAARVVGHAAALPPEVRTAATSAGTGEVLAAALSAAVRNVLLYRSLVQSDRRGCPSPPRRPERVRAELLIIEAVIATGEGAKCSRWAASRRRSRSHSAEADRQGESPDRGAAVYAATATSKTVVIKYGGHAMTDERAAAHPLPRTSCCLKHTSALRPGGRARRRSADRRHSQERLGQAVDLCRRSPRHR